MRNLDEFQMMQDAIEKVMTYFMTLHGLKNSDGRFEFKMTRHDYERVDPEYRLGIGVYFDHCEHKEGEPCRGTIITVVCGDKQLMMQEAALVNAEPRGEA